MSTIFLKSQITNISLNDHSSQNYLQSGTMVCPELISEQNLLYIKGSREILSGLKKMALNLKIMLFA